MSYHLPFCVDLPRNPCSGMSFAGEMEQIISNLCLLTTTFDAKEKKYILHFSRSTSASSFGNAHVEALLSDSTNCWIAGITECYLDKMKDLLHLVQLSSVYEFLMCAVTQKDIQLQVEKFPASITFGRHCCAAISLPLYESKESIGRLLYSMASSNEHLISRDSSILQPVAVRFGTSLRLKEAVPKRGAHMSIVNPHVRKRTAVKGFQFKLQNHS